MSVLASFLGYYDFKEWAGVWVGPLLFCVLIVLLVVMTRQMRPTRPQQIKPEASPQIAWDEILSSTVGSEAWNSRDLKSRPH